MAFFDFLSQPIGGYSGGDPSMQGPTPSGESLGTPQGITWGQLIGAAMQYSNSPAGRGFGSLLSQQSQLVSPNVNNPSSIPIYNISQNQPDVNNQGNNYLASNAYSQQGQGNTSIGEAMQIASMFI